MEKFSVIGSSICWDKSITVPKTHKKKIVEELKRISEQITQAIAFQGDASEKTDLKVDVKFWLETKTGESYYALDLDLDGFGLTLSIIRYSDDEESAVAYLRNIAHGVEPVPLKEYEEEKII